MSLPACRFGTKSIETNGDQAGWSLWVLYAWVRREVAKYAAIDIGSNSIRMEAAEVTPGAPTRILASERQVTRLGESVFRNGSISEQALEFACTVLGKFGEQYR